MSADIAHRLATDPAWWHLAAADLFATGIALTIISITAWSTR